MAHRKILTTRQEEAIFALPRDRALLMQYYTLAIDDLQQCQLLTLGPLNDRVNRYIIIK